MCLSTPQSGTTVQTHKGSHHVLQKKLLQNFFSSSNKFSQNVFWTFLQFSPRTVSTRPHKYVLSDAQKCWFVLVWVADLRTNMQWKNTWLVSSLICLDREAVLRWLWSIKKNLNLEVVDTPHWHLPPPPIWRWSGRPQLQSQVLPKREKREIWSAQVTMVDNGWQWLTSDTG